MANNHLYNDSSEQLINLYWIMQRIDTEKFINSVDYIINEYHLSNVSKNGYD